MMDFKATSYNAGVKTRPSCRACMCVGVTPLVVGHNAGKQSNPSVLQTLERLGAACQKSKVRLYRLRGGFFK